MRPAESTGLLALDLFAQQLTIALPQPVDGHTHGPLAHLQPFGQLAVRQGAGVGGQGGLERIEQPAAAGTLELAAQLQFGEFGFDGTLAYTDAEMRGSGTSAALDGLRPAQTPEWAASGTVSWRPRDGMTFSATLRHVGLQYEDDQEGDALPAATTVDLFAQVRLVDGLSFVGRVENLFDETIITRNQGGSMDLGVPLTVWGGLRYGF